MTSHLTVSELISTSKLGLTTEKRNVRRCTASHKWKSPFKLLEKEPSGAFKNQWWAIVDGLVTAVCAWHRWQAELSSNTFVHGRAESFEITMGTTFTWKYATYIRGYKGVPVVGQTAADILFTAQEQAVQILTSARQKAESLQAESLGEAVNLLLSQQKKAERLLGVQSREAATKGQQAHGKADAIAASALLERQRLAAEALRASEALVATKLQETSGQQAVELMMKAHREAAAVLLKARIEVEELFRQGSAG